MQEQAPPPAAADISCPIVVCDTALQFAQPAPLNLTARTVVLLAEPAQPCLHPAHRTADLADRPACAQAALLLGLPTSAVHVEPFPSLSAVSSGDGVGLSGCSFDPADSKLYFHPWGTTGGGRAPGFGRAICEVSGIRRVSRCWNVYSACRSLSDLQLL